MILHKFFFFFFTSLKNITLLKETMYKCARIQRCTKILLEKNHTSSLKINFHIETIIACYE